MPPLAAENSRNLSGALSASSYLFGAMCLTLVAGGYAIKERHYIDAGSGFGYLLGVFGGLIMLALLAYPLQKRFRIFHHDNSHLNTWFKVHMALGLIGPISILFHSNFSLGSINSNVALYCMIAMASSGFIGRFLYAKIHYGLYGKLCTIDGLIQQTRITVGELTALAPDVDQATYQQVHQTLIHYQLIVEQQRSTSAHLAQIIALNWQTRSTKQKIRVLLNHTLADTTTPISTVKLLRKDVNTLLVTTRRAAELGFYRRLFSLWHLFHLPIFFMLIITGLIHVYAVHSY